MSALSTPLSSIRSGQSTGARAGDAWIYMAVAGSVWVSWWVVRVFGLNANTEFGYWLGVAGGSMMLALFAYPLRKRVRWFQRLGAARSWFVVHMTLGVAGPVAILLHSAFHIGSINAGVALVSMLVVAASGVVGRFLYLRTHRGLSGDLESLSSLRLELGVQAKEAHRALAFAPGVEAQLECFEAVLAKHVGGKSWLFAGFVTLPLERMRAEQRVRHELKLALREHARQQGWSRERRSAEARTLMTKLQSYFRLGQRVVQFDGAVRLFALWHVLHIPFVYVMVLCAVVHVVAVHVY